MDKLIKDLRALAALYDGCVPAIYDLLAKAADELEKRRWIPVTQRLPEAFEDVAPECGADMRGGVAE